MSDLDALIRDRSRGENPPHPIYKGFIAVDATTNDEAVEVLITDFSGELRQGPCRFSLSQGSNLPKRGDECLIAFDSDGDPWITNWWSQDPISSASASGKGFVNHGSNGAVPRPSGWASVEWFGSVPPMYGTDVDTWIDTTSETLKLIKPLPKMIHMHGGWDQYFTDDSHRAEFEQELDMIVGFEGTPQWDRHKNWRLDSYGYLNLFSETNSPWAVHQNDSDSASLWLPFDQLPNGTYARRSMDLRSSAYRDGFIAECRRILDNGAKGIFVDDVNVDIERMFKRTGGGAPLTDFSTGAYYTGTGGRIGWAALVGDFLHAVTAAVKTTHPNAKFIFNPFWSQLHPDRWNDPRLGHMVDACDWVIIEHGFSDGGLTGDEGIIAPAPHFAMRSVLLWLDFVHARGKNFIIYTGTNEGSAYAAYEMAAFLAKREDGDILGMWEESPRWPNYFPVFRNDLGVRLEYLDSNLDDTAITVGFERGRAIFTPGAPELGAVISDVPLPAPVGGGRQFGSSDDSAIFSPGGFVGEGAFTIAALVRKTTAPGAQAYVMSLSELATGGRGGLGIVNDGGDRVLLGGGGGGTWSNSVTILQNEWYIIVVTMAAGSNNGTMHAYRLSTATWSHGAGWTARNNLAAHDRLVVGSWHDVTNRWPGDIAVVAAWDEQLNQTQIETLDSGTDAWAVLGPEFLAEGRHRAEGLAVAPFEVLEGSSVLTSTGETIQSSSAPAGWSWSS